VPRSIGPAAMTPTKVGECNPEDSPVTLLTSLQNNTSADLNAHLIDLDLQRF
jgi:hypothetical protein